MNWKKTASGLASRWKLISALTLLGALLGLVMTLVTPTIYTTSSLLFLGSPGVGDTTSAYQGDLFSQQRAMTYAQMVTSDKIVGQVRQELNLPMPPSELAAEITAAPVPKTVLLEIKVTDGSAQVAADIANSVVGKFAGYVATLETPSGSTVPNTTVSVVRKAEVPAAPAAPHLGNNVALGLVLGLFLGMAVAWALTRFDSRVRSSEEAAEVAGSPLLGAIPDDNGFTKGVDSSESSVSTETLEAFRRLRTNVRFLDLEAPPKVISIASPNWGEGKTTIAIGLARSIAASDLRVLLVDANLRKPALAHRLALRPAPGLTDVLRGEVSLDAAIQNVDSPGFAVMTAGQVPSNPSELLGSVAMTEVLASLRDKFDYVLLDSAAFLPVADSAVLTAVTDGAILVVRSGQTRSKSIVESRTAIEAADVNVLGVVFNAESRKPNVHRTRGDV